jgi:hypothetical protein
MQMPTSRSRPHQRTLPFPEPHQANLWNRLPAEHRQACRQVLSQLLEQIVCQERNHLPIHERSDSHEREASA